MYRYVDGKGNEFVLLPEGECRLCYRPKGQGEGTMDSDLPLSRLDYMRLLAAFDLAIDNKLGHCELCNQRTTTILCTQEGRQRRYFLSPSSPERADLEGLLSHCLGSLERRNVSGY